MAGWHRQRRRILAGKSRQGQRACRPSHPARFRQDRRQPGSRPPRRGRRTRLGRCPASLHLCRKYPRSRPATRQPHKPRRRRPECKRGRSACSLRWQARRPSRCRPPRSSTNVGHNWRQGLMFCTPSARLRRKPGPEATRRCRSRIWPSCWCRRSLSRVRAPGPRRPNRQRWSWKGRTTNRLSSQPPFARRRSRAVSSARARRIVCRSVFAGKGDCMLGRNTIASGLGLLRLPSPPEAGHRLAGAHGGPLVPGGIPGPSHPSDPRKSLFPDDPPLRVNPCASF